MAQDVTTTANRTYSAPALQTTAQADIIRWCLSGSHREASKLFLINLPDGNARNVLLSRAKQLLQCFKEHDNKEIAILILDMLASYDVAQVKQITAAERKAAAAVYVRELYGVPTWAVAQACNKIRLGQAPDISHQFKPTPIQVRVLAVSVAQPWKNEYVLIGEILGAPKWMEGPSQEERDAIGIKWRKLADELKSGELREAGLSAELIAAETAQRERILQRASDISEAAIKKEWATLGEEPRKAGQVMISPSLVRYIEAQRKAREGQTPSDPMVL